MRNLTPSTYQTPVLVHDWDSIADLRAKFDQCGFSGVLIEDAGAGDIAVGPYFAPDLTGCIDCYIARRAANGAKRILPCADADHQKVSALVKELIQSSTSDGIARQFILSKSDHISKHVLLPMPNCPQCSSVRPTGGSLTLHAACDARLGIVSTVDMGMDPDTGYYTARANGAYYKTVDGGPVFNQGFAADKTADGARIRALGEAVERYSGALAVPNAAAAPHNWNIWSEARTFGPDRIRWVLARSPQGTAHAVPARRISLPYKPCIDEAPLQAPLSSTGMAAAQNLNAAINKGYYEMIERDVFMRSWRGGGGVWPLRSEPNDPIGMRTVQIEHNGDLPVVAAFFESQTVPYTATGLAARSTCAEAREAAIREAVAAQIWVKERLASGDPLPVGPPQTLYDHAVVHAVDLNLRSARIKWLETPAADVIGTDAPHVCFQTARENTFAVELTTNDVAMLGVSVARVVSPERVELENDATCLSLPGTTVPHPYA